eukprot:3772111-Pleurochrysis_carterae.AAC.4
MRTRPPLSTLLCEAVPAGILDSSASDDGPGRVDSSDASALAVLFVVGAKYACSFTPGCYFARR